MDSGTDVFLQIFRNCLEQFFTQIQSTASEITDLPLSHAQSLQYLEMAP